MDLGARATSESLVSETLWYSVSSWRAARRAGCLGEPVTQIYSIQIAAWARELTSARKHGSGFGRGPPDGLVHKTRANARISQHASHCRHYHQQQMAPRRAAAQHKTCR